MTREELDPAKLLRKIIAGLCRKPVNEKVPLWSVVGELTSHGSGISYEIVESVGIDPNQLVERPQWFGESQAILDVCRECKALLNEPGDVCEQCNDWDATDLEEHVPSCPACGGTGDAPDNGTNMGECDECCGTGVLE